jgi:hypothetical protein
LNIGQTLSRATAGVFGICLKGGDFLFISGSYDSDQYKFIDLFVDPNYKTYLSRVKEIDTTNKFIREFKFVQDLEKPYVGFVLEDEFVSMKMIEQCVNMTYVHKVFLKGLAEDLEYMFREELKNGSLLQNSYESFGRKKILANISKTLKSGKLIEPFVGLNEIEAIKRLVETDKNTTPEEIEATARESCRLWLGVLGTKDITDIVYKVADKYVATYPIEHYESAELICSYIVERMTDDFTARALGHDNFLNQDWFEEHIPYMKMYKNVHRDVNQQIKAYWIQKFCDIKEGLEDKSLLLISNSDSQESKESKKSKKSEESKVAIRMDIDYFLETLFVGSPFDESDWCSGDKRSSVIDTLFCSAFKIMLPLNPDFITKCWRDINRFYDGEHIVVTVVDGEDIGNLQFRHEKYPSLIKKSGSIAVFLKAIDKTFDWATQDLYSLQDGKNHYLVYTDIDKLLAPLLDRIYLKEEYPYLIKAARALIFKERLAVRSIYYMPVIFCWLESKYSTGSLKPVYDEIFKICDPYTLINVLLRGN